MTRTTIYYVEDDRDDASILQEAFAGVGYAITVFPDPVALFHRLHGDDLLPTLIILDVNLPLMNGIEALRLLKAEPKFQRIPVALLTTSPTLAGDAVDEKQLLFLKPTEYSDYEKIVARLLRYSNAVPDDAGPFP